MTRKNRTASPIVRAVSPNVPAVATALANAIRNHAVTSSIAAQAIVSAPTGRLSIRRSVRMRASTGNAVIDIATPMNSAKATNFVSGPTSVEIGGASGEPAEQPRGEHHDHRGEEEDRHELAELRALLRASDLLARRPKAGRRGQHRLGARLRRRRAGSGLDGRGQLERDHREVVE